MIKLPEGFIYSPEHPLNYVDESGSGPFQWTNNDIALWNATWALMPEVDGFLSGQSALFTHEHAKLAGALMGALKARHQSEKDAFLVKLTQPPTTHVAQRLIYFAGIVGLQVKHDIYARLGLRESLIKVAPNIVHLADFKDKKLK